MGQLRRLFLSNLNDVFITLTLLETGIWFTSFLIDLLFFAHYVFAGDEGIDSTPTRTICTLVNTICVFLRVLTLPLLWYNVLQQIEVNYVKTWLFISIILDVVVLLTDLTLEASFTVIPQLVLFGVFRGLVYHVLLGLTEDMTRGQGESLFPSKGVKGIYSHYKEETLSFVPVVLTAQIVMYLFLAINLFVSDMIISECWGSLPRNLRGPSGWDMTYVTLLLFGSAFFSLGLLFLRRDWRTPLKVWTCLSAFEFLIIVLDAGIVTHYMFIVNPFETSTYFLVLKGIWLIMIYFEGICLLMIKGLTFVSIWRYLNRTCPGGVQRLSEEGK